MEREGFTTVELLFGIGSVSIAAACSTLRSTSRSLERGSLGLPWTKLLAAS